MHITYKYRVKSLNGELNRQARAVNFVWNYCNDVQKQALKWGKRWPTGFDLSNLTSGTSAEIGLNSGTICDVGRQYAKSRNQQRRPFLKWRGKKSLGWVPLKGRYLKREGDAFRYYGRTYRVFDSRPLPAGKICDGSSFSQDARGNWYLNIVVEVAAPDARPCDRAVGVDLGLKDFASLSTGEKVENPRHFHNLESKLAAAQRANHKRQAQNIHAKIANRRKDSLHKLSNRLTKEFDFIAVGNINAKALSQTSMAEGVQDAGWSPFRFMLRYKAIRHGATFEEVSEYLSTQVCSSCASVTGPKGVADLGIRQWSCCECGAIHDRDVNSAINILVRSGHRTLVEGVAA